MNIDNKILNDFTQAVTTLAGKQVPLETLNIQQLEGGMVSPHVYRFTLRGTDYVFRAIKPKNSPWELTAHRYAAAIGIAPDIVFINRAHTCMVMPYIKGHTLTPDDCNDDTIEQFGTLLAKLHTYSDEFPRTKTQNDRFDKHYKSCREKKIALPVGYENLYKHFMAQGATFSASDHVLCHKDIHRSNIIVADSGKLFLIDWASAALRNRFSDLAQFSFDMDLDDKKLKLLLESYLKRAATQEELSFVRLMEKRFSFVLATIWLDFSGITREQLPDELQHLLTCEDITSDTTFPDGKHHLKNRTVVSIRSDDKLAIWKCGISFLKTYLKWYN